MVGFVQIFRNFTTEERRPWSDNMHDFRMGTELAVALLLLLSALLFWSWSLHRQMAKRAAKQRESEEKYKALVENAGEVIVVAQDGILKFVNRRIFELLGHPPEALLEKPFTDFIHPEDRPEVLARHLKRLDGKTFPDVYTFRVIDRDGETRVVEANAVRIAWDGKPATLNFLTDVTERRRMERALRESEERYRLTTEAGRIGVWDWDFVTGEMYVDPSVKQILGYRDHEIGGRISDWTAHVHPEDADSVSAALKACITKEAPEIFIEYRMYHKDGGVHWFLVRGTVMRDGSGKARRIVGTNTDITERKKAEMEIQARENLLSKVMEVLPVGLWLADAEGRLIRSNAAGRRIWGAEPLVPPEEYGVFRARRLPSGEELAPEDWALVETIRDGRTILNELLEIDAFDGAKRTILNSTAPVLDDEGKIQAAVIVNVDVTDQRKTEAERERLMAAIEQAVETVIITAPDDTIQYVNPAFEAATGYARHEALGQTPRILKSGRQDGAFYRDLRETIASGRTWSGRMVNRRKDGSLFTEEATISPVFDAGGEIVNYVAVKRDITAHLRLEDQFRQAQRLESVGRLAGGVAHDFNNILSVILGYGELAMEKVPPDDALHDDLEKILEAAGRSRDITRQLLAFARKETIAPETLDLNVTVEGMLKMLRRLIGENIDLSWRPAAGLWPVKMDPSQIDQLLVNLCVNARDSITDVGKSTIETNMVTFNREYCTDNEGVVPGDFVMLGVSDDGCGMDRETLDMIFEPFFTTKEMGRGTGLGLATVYGIVKQNKGFIHVYSEPGKSTTFKLYLPRFAGASADTRKPPSDEIPGGRGETILVTEDEAPILKLAMKMLGTLGYTVLAAGTPTEAIRLAEAHPQEISLLITDVVMPEMNGRELAGRLQALYPKLRCLFISGYTANVIAHRGVLEAGVNFLQKPFSRKDLALKVRSALDAAPLN